MTIEEFYTRTAWTRTDLAREAHVSTNTIIAMEKGENVSLASVRKVALAMTNKLGRSIKPDDIQGVVISKR